MLLIDALYINNGGGRVLLDYLVQKLVDHNVEAFYLFDERCLNDFNYIPADRRLYLKASLSNRYTFYKNNFQKFTKVFCFGNLPPTLRLDIPVYTYLQQTLYLNVPKEFSILQRLLFKTKSFIFSKLLKNTDFLLVQSNLVKEGFLKKYKFNSNNVLVLPFYPNHDLKDEERDREADSYIYVSAGTPHKNHIRLLNAFCKFYDEIKRGKLYVTVDFDIFISLGELIKEKIEQGYPIVNLGFIKREQLIKQYNKTKYLVFPSLEESFGLGIVEAIECGCEVIGANLPYTFQVCEPSITFDPFEEKSIYLALVESIKNNVHSTQQIIKNEINQLIKLLN
ncbi:glycosyltransferase [Chryseobacterium polytrichastri]|uniref:Glycosyltransferase involved in cell wall bisynthesis n=1 Tax=Chryseobacterium polytrichastri TaxID=1302687 RepID=A0A1M6U489_9FLAO|nr:glycosyltransferase [Chryseobacterium polytrichastri]SHK63961.1 Glycosyltransferase involved in cell wall bisynthesis [Chryseobacterium polytrichastri]